jgi:transcriptional regulator with XRE-family HTH domain
VFYDTFCKLCAEKNISPTKASLQIGLSKSTATKWKNTGATPSGDTLNKIADYFEVTVDYLLGKDKKEKPADKGEPELTFDDFTYAMHNESGNLSEEDKEILLNLARDLAKHRMEKDKREEK